MGIVKWTYDMIRNEAIKYKTTGEFRENNKKAYDAACRQKILSDFFDKINKFWSIDELKEEALKYKTKNDFIKNNYNAYQAALRNGIIDDLFENIRTIWDDELVRKESLKYKTKKEFSKNCSGGYNYALKHNLIDELYDNVNESWTDEHVEELAKSCKTKKEFYKNYLGAYEYARRNDLLKKFTWLVNNDGYKRCVYIYKDDENKVAYVGLTGNKEERHNSHKTGIFRERKTKSIVFDYFSSIGKDVPEPLYLEEGLDLIEAQEKEDYYRKLYEELGYKMLNKAKTGIGVGSVGCNKWSKKKVIEVASQYNTKTELRRAYKGAYEYAVKNNFIDELFDNVNKSWDDDGVREVASKCKNRKEFIKKYKGAYCYAERNNLLDELFGKVIHWDENTVIELALKCKSRGDFHKKYKNAYNYAYRKKNVRYFIS